MRYEHWYKNKPELIVRRRRLRRESTWAEKLFWIKVKDNQIGFKFRRQFSIGPFIVDFYCHDLKLIVEIDGFTHENEKQKLYDKKRQEYLERRDYNVIRYTDDQVHNQTESTFLHLRQICENLAKGNPT